MGQERKLRVWPGKEGAEGDACPPKLRRGRPTAEGRECAPSTGRTGAPDRPCGSRAPSPPQTHARSPSPSPVRQADTHFWGLSRG